MSSGLFFGNRHFSEPGFRMGLERGVKPQTGQEFKVQCSKFNVEKRSYDF
jgi:hypothetical protein